MIQIDSQTLRDAEMFKNLSDDVLDALARRCRVVELPAGETLFQQNSPPDTMYLLVTGQVHIVREHPDGEQVILATEGPYYLIGELSALVDQPRTGAVVAVSDSTLVALDKQAFDEVCAQTPELAVRVMAYLGQRLYRMNLEVREHAIGNIPARVASLLVLLGGDKNGPVENEVYLRRVARAVAADPDRVEHLLQAWTQQGYLSYNARRLVILNIETLREIAGQL